MTVIRLLFFLCVVTAFCSYQTISRNQVEIRPSVQRIVERLKEDQVLHLGAPVGFSGKPETNNKYYRLWRRLQNKATDSELLQLAEDSSNLIKLYAFALLVERGNPATKQLFERNLQNDSEVWATGGCTGVIWRVNVFMFNELRPDFLPKKIMFSQEEFEKYKKLFE